jgi:antitoxin MazE
MTQAIVGKWGNNLAVRLPGEIVRMAGIHDGERVEIETQDGAIVIRPAEPRIDLDDLFRGKTPQAWREAYAGARDDAEDWGPDVGREVVAE